MPVTLSLVENGYVMVIAITDPWDVRELTKQYPQQEVYFEQATHKIHTLVDMTATRQMPSGILAARQQAPSVSHPKTGYVVVAGASSVAKTITETGFKVKHFNRSKFFPTTEEAWAFLRQLIASESSDVPVIKKEV